MYGMFGQKKKQNVIDKTDRAKIPRCKWVFDSKNCPNKSHTQGYCLKHLKKGLVKDDISKNIIHCTNHIRGCCNILSDDLHKTCKDCREAEKKNRSS